jgi:hypothetical protein
LRAKAARSMRAHRSLAAGSPVLRRARIDRPQGNGSFVLAGVPWRREGAAGGFGGALAEAVASGTGAAAGRATVAGADGVAVGAVAVAAADPAPVATLPPPPACPVRTHAAATAPATRRSA